MNVLNFRMGAGLGAMLMLATGGAWAEDMDWSITPYAWVINTDFSTKINVPEDGQQSASDIFGKLDFAAQVHVEGSGEQFGVLFDFTNLRLSDRTDQGDYDLKSSSSTTLVEAALMYHVPQPSGNVFSVLLGARVLDVDVELDLLSPQSGDSVFETSLDATLTDFMFGVRYKWVLSDKWDMLARVDVASGDTDFSTNLNVGVKRAVGSSGELVLGYRYLKVKFERASALLEPTLEVSGPEIGYSFNF